MQHAVAERVSNTKEKHFTQSVCSGEMLIIIKMLNGLYTLMEFDQKQAIYFVFSYILGWSTRQYQWIAF